MSQPHPPKKSQKGPIFFLFPFKLPSTFKYSRLIQFTLHLPFTTHLQHNRKMTSIASLPATPVAAKEPVPVPKSLDELVELLHKELGANGLACEGVDVDRVQALMTNYQSNEEDWKKYALFDKGRYTRNLVDDGNGKFNLMILAWPENVGR